MKKTITLNKKYLRYFILSFLTSMLIVFAIEHFSDFSYITNSESQYDSQGRINLTSYVSYDTPLASIKMSTPFGSNLSFDGSSYNVGDMTFTGGKFNPYTNKLKFYFRAFVKDFKYVLFVSIGFILIFVFFAKFKLKFQ